MKHLIGIAICLAGSLAYAHADDADPVVRAKARRALGDSHDLPPIPRGLVEPPPLPPPELHTHDIRKQRRTAPPRRKGMASAKKPAPKAGSPQSSSQAGKKPAAKQARTTSRT